jgi:aspartyl-tRNA(Asn)/glutamyl-tRNA(Gln) amidotransferase subunit A
MSTINPLRPSTPVTAIEHASVEALSQGLQRGDFSSVEITRHLLARQAAHAGLGAFLAVNEAAALAQAAAADARRAGGQAGPLTGVPLAHKDIFVTSHPEGGLATTAGSKMLAGYQSPFDATVVARLGAGLPGEAPGAGMVTLGKLNCDEFAMGSANENSAFGAVKNPWDATRVPGGSSGGSAAAVAAGLVQAGGESHHAVAAAHAVGGLDAGDAAEAGGLADGAAGVGARGRRYQAGRHRRGRAAR